MTADQFLNTYHNASTAPSADVPPDLASFMLAADPVLAEAAELARVVAVSRSVFAERFTAMVGQPTMQYLSLWRMQLASRMLIDGRHMADVAEAVGYESEAAFSRAFKKVVGESPGTWRATRRA